MIVITDFSKDDVFQKFVRSGIQLPASLHSGFTVRRKKHRKLWALFSLAPLHCGTDLPEDILNRTGTSYCFKDPLVSVILGERNSL